MPSKLTIVWDQNNLPVDGQLFTLRTTMAIRFVTLRVGQYQSTIGSFYAECRGNFRNAFLIDYNPLNIYTVEYGGTTDLYITHPNSGHFVQGDIVLPGSGILSATVEDTADALPITVQSVVYSQGSSPCSNVVATVTTSSLATKITSPVQIDPNSQNPFTFEVPRGYFFRIEGENADGNTFKQSYISPGYLIESSFNVTVVNSPNGATATAIIPAPSGTTLEYSINNIDWQSSNVFTNLTPGSYTMYLRDTLGCSLQKAFTIGDFEQEGVGITDPIADLPAKSNSIRFHRVQVDGDQATDENTKSMCTPNVLNPKMEIQKFKRSKTTKTQIRSNYETITVTVTNEDGSETIIPVQKVTSNVGLQDSRDATKYDLGNGQTGIYFTSGNIYEYGTSNVSGSYALNGALPAWAYLGNFVYLDSAWYEIVNIGYDEQRSAEVIVINAVYTGIDILTTVASIYNTQEYEVHEFDITWGFLTGNFYKVRIDETDTKTEYPDVSYESEILEVRDDFHRHIDIVYFNDENSGNIMYSTGIQHCITVPIIDIVGQVSEESETERTDTTAYLVEASVHELDIVSFSYVTKGLMRKISLALNHDNIFINGVGYVKDGALEVDPVRNTNLYKIVATMIKTGEAFTTNTQGDGTGIAYEVPNLLSDDGNYVKYQ